MNRSPEICCDWRAGQSAFYGFGLAYHCFDTAQMQICTEDCKTEKGRDHSSGNNKGLSN